METPLSSFSPTTGILVQPLCAADEAAAAGEEGEPLTLLSAVLPNISKMRAVCEHAFSTSAHPLEDLQLLKVMKIAAVFPRD